MSIGKNSIKRAVNNGYSNVKTAAPDMENSEVLTPVAPIAPEFAPTVKVPQKKTTAKKPAACKTTTQKAQPTVKTPAKRTATPKKPVAKEEKSYVNVGGEMPFWLL